MDGEAREEEFVPMVFGFEMGETFTVAFAPFEAREVIHADPFDVEARAIVFIGLEEAFDFSEAFGMGQAMMFGESDDSTFSAANSDIVEFDEVRGRMNDELIVRGEELSDLSIGFWIGTVADGDDLIALSGKGLRLGPGFNGLDAVHASIDEWEDHGEIERAGLVRLHYVLPCQCELVMPIDCLAACFFCKV